MLFNSYSYEIIYTNNFIEYILLGMDGAPKLPGCSCCSVLSLLQSQQHTVVSASDCRRNGTRSRPPTWTGIVANAVVARARKSAQENEI